MGQGVNENLRGRLTRTLAYAAGRYGHVIHPEIAHEPAADVASLLLEGPGAGWASRVMFSDDGFVAASRCHEPWLFPAVKPYTSLH